MAAKEESEDSGIQQAGRFAEIRQDDLIEKLVPDPATPPDVKILFGLVGRSTIAGYWRIYLTPLLNVYVEISEKDVLHHQHVPLAQNPLGGTLLWVRREAKLLQTRTTPHQVQGRFLKGDIAARFLPNVGIDSQFVWPHPFSGPGCPIPLTLYCSPSLFDFCLPSLFDFCFPSLFDICSGGE